MEWKRLSCIFALAFATVANAQNDALTITNDVGLTLEGPTPGLLFGATCTFTSCAVHQAGGITRGTSRAVRVYGAPYGVYALAISVPPSICVGYPYLNNGFITANLLAIRQPYVITLGTLGPPMAQLPCTAGEGTYTLVVPVQLPAGLQFLMQGLASSQVVMPAFTPTVQASIL